jgi:hypothetical protein
MEGVNPTIVRTVNTTMYPQYNNNKKEDLIM